MLIDKNQHDQKYVTVGRSITSPKLIDPTGYYLPKDSVIHFIPPSSQIYNMDMTNSFTRNSLNRLYLFNVEKILEPIGNISNVYVNLSNIKRQYLKINPNVREIKDLKGFGNVNDPIIINYSYLLHLYKYYNNVLILYQEWLDVRTTMWKTIEIIGSTKEHFIRYSLPDVLPTKIDLGKYISKFTSQGLHTFNNNAAFDLLELWRIMHDKVDSPDKHVSENVKDNIYLSFCIPGKIINMKLRDFISDYSSISTDEGTMLLNVYTFLDRLFSMSTVVNTKSLLKEASGLSDENITPDKKIENEINKLGMEGSLSAGEQKLLLKLSTKYRTVQDPHGSSLTLDKMTVEPKDLILPRKIIIQPSIVIHDSSILEASLHGSDEHYINNVFPKDICQVIMTFHNAGIIVKDVNIKRKHTPVTKTNTYSVNLQPVNGVPSTIKFTLPVIEKDGTFLSGGVKNRLDKQIGELPICKININKVALTSYYGKSFVLRNENTVSNYNKYILKVLIECSVTNDPITVFGIKYGDSKIFDNLPRKYTGVACKIKSFTTKQYDFFFNYNKIHEYFTESELQWCKHFELTPVGRGKHSDTSLLLGMDMSGSIFIMNTGIKGWNSENIGPLTTVIAPSEEYVDVPEFTELAIYSKRIPLIIVFAYIYGLDEALSRLKITYEILPVNTRIVNTDDTYIIKFKDVKYKLYVKTPELMLLVNGLKTVSKLTVNYKGSDFNRQIVYNAIITALGATPYYLREIKLMFDMFVDPITYDILVSINEPTTFEGLLLKSNKMLLNDYRPKETSIRYKGYERMAGAVYAEMVNSVRTFRQQGNNYLNPVGMPPKAVFLNILQDQSKVLVEESNPIHNIKEQESVTYSGAGGRSSITMTKETRGFNESDIGIVSEASPDSSKVGIRFYLTSNPNIDNVRGIPTHVNIKDIKASSAISTSANITPGIVHDEGKRVNHANVHHGHGVACVNYVSPPYRTGFEETVGGRSCDLFCINADTSGVVSDIKNDKITVKYSDDTTRVYKTGVIHGTATGVTIPHTLTTYVTVGQKLKEGDVIAYNTGYFKPSELNPSNVVYASGVLARVALLENSDTNEDGCLLSKKIAEKLLTPSSKIHPIVLDFDKTIYNLVNIGSVVEVDDTLCTIENSQPDEMDVRDINTIKTLSRITANNPKSKVHGVVRNIEVLYNGDIEDMNISLQDIVKKYDNLRAKDAKEIGDGRPRAGLIDEPIRVVNKEVEANQVVIKIYVDGDLGMGVGDKVVFAHLLKGTVSTVESNPILSEDGQEVDAYFGGLSIGNRIVESPIRSGIYNEVLEKISETMANIYFS